MAYNKLEKNGVRSTINVYVETMFEYRNDNRI